MGLKYIKNSSGGTGTWVGQQLDNNEYYLIQSVEETSWANNSQVLTDIGSGDLQVAKSDSGSDDIIDVSTAINYLKNDAEPRDSSGRIIRRPTAFADASNLWFRGTGVTGTATKTTNTSIDYKMPENRFINGMEAILQDQAWGDRACFQVVDVDNILGYGAGTVLDEFGTDWYFTTDKERQGPYILPYPALVLKDLYIRLVYKSTGTVNDVKVSINYFLHKKA